MAKHFNIAKQLRRNKNGKFLRHDLKFFKKPFKDFLSRSFHQQIQELELMDIRRLKFDSIHYSEAESYIFSLLVTLQVS